MTGPGSGFDARVADLLKDPLCVARRTADEGTRVIGYVSAEGPVELILAAGALPVRLRGRRDAEADTPHADEFLESAFVPEMRAVAEQWLTGALACVEAVVFPRSSDSAQRLYYYLCELQRRGLCAGPRPLLFDTASIARASSFEHTLASTRLLAASLGVDVAGAGAKAKPGVALVQALGRVVQRETLLRRLAARRLESAGPTGSSAQRVLRAAEHDWTAGFDDALSAWLDRPARVQHGRRLLLAGSAPPDERLHMAVEAAGGSIVRELVETERASGAAAGAGASAAGAKDALEAIARSHHGARSPAQRMLDGENFLVEQARAARADGVILWLIEEDEALPWEVAGQARMLAAASIPALVLTRQQWRADAASLQAVGRFVAGLERTS